MILVDLLGLPAFGQELPADAKGCKDSALLSRVSGCYVSSCKRNDWDEVEIAVAQGKTQKVEGQMEEIYYQCSADYSRLKVVRNAETALRQAGYTMVFQGTYDGDPAVTARLGPQWVFVYTGNGRYWVRTVKAKEMAQEMKATAEAMASGIAATGHFAVYGIYFDTDKADIKPESEPALKETVRLLQQAPKLNVFIVGHTDNTGDYLRNMKLSEARANAVAAALTAKHGIAATRLKAAGVGPVAPVAPNKTEEGRAKNRRVELVER
jgi:outer membrane protein OmpA-like peptidoglycan-associated protein